MTPEQARSNFDRALREELTGRELAEFEGALSGNAQLCAEFEAHADTRSGDDLSVIDGWLRNAGERAARERPLIQPGLVASIATAASGARRGRLIRMGLGVTGLVAAAAIALVVMIPRRAQQSVGWPDEQPGQVAMLSESARYFSDATEFSPGPGVKLSAAHGSLLRPVLGGFELLDGRVEVTLEAGVKHQVQTGNHHVSATGPASFSVNAQAETFPEVPFPKESPMARPGWIARFGAMAFTLTVSAISGQVDVKAGEFEQIVAQGKTGRFQAEEERKPPKAEEAFKHLDKNSDGKLDDRETDEKMLKDFDDDKNGSVSLEEFKAHFRPRRGPGEPPTAEEAFARHDKNSDGKLDAIEAGERMLKDFDDDKSGDISLAEFKKHFRPGAERKPPTPEDAFKRHDKNSDGKLDGNELDERMLKDFDDDKSGDISLEEFKKHFKAPMPPRRGPPDGPGTEGPRPPRGDGPRPPRGEGEGPRPPRGEGDGPRPPRGEGPRPPRE